MAFSSFSTLNQLTNKTNKKLYIPITPPPLIEVAYINGTLTNSGTRGNTISTNTTIPSSTTSPAYNSSQSIRLENTAASTSNTKFLSLQNISLSAPLTICCWVNLIVTPGSNARMFELGNLFVLFNAGTDTAFFINGTAWSIQKSTAPKSPMTAGSWYHWAIVFSNSTTATIYMNGQAMIPSGKTQSTNTVSALTISNSTFYVGRGSTSDGGVAGYMDNIRVYGVALSAAQILSIYSGTS